MHPNTPPVLPDVLAGQVERWSETLREFRTVADQILAMEEHLVDTAFVSAVDLGYVAPPDTLRQALAQLRRQFEFL